MIIFKTSQGVERMKKAVQAFFLTLLAMVIGSLPAKAQTVDEYLISTAQIKIDQAPVIDYVNLTVPLKKGKITLPKGQSQLYESQQFLLGNVNVGYHVGYGRGVSYYRNQDGSVHSVRLLQVSAKIPFGSAFEGEIQALYIPEAPLKTSDLKLLENINQFVAKGAIKNHASVVVTDPDGAVYKKPLFDLVQNGKVIYSDRQKIAVEFRKKIRDGLYLNSILVAYHEYPLMRFLATLGNDELTDPHESTQVARVDLEYTNTSPIRLAFNEEMGFQETSDHNGKTVVSLLRHPIDQTIVDGAQVAFRGIISPMLGKDSPFDQVANRIRHGRMVALADYDNWILAGSEAEGPSLRDLYIPQRMFQENQLSDVHASLEAYLSAKKASFMTDPHITRWMETANRSSAGGDKHEFTNNLTREIAWTIESGYEGLIDHLRRGEMNTYQRGFHVYHNGEDLFCERGFKYNYKYHYATGWHQNNEVGRYCGETVLNALNARAYAGPRNGGFSPQKPHTMRAIKLSHNYYDNQIWTYLLTGDVFVKRHLQEHATDLYLSYYSPVATFMHQVERDARSIITGTIFADVLSDTVIGQKIQARLPAKWDRVLELIDDHIARFNFPMTDGGRGPNGCPVEFCTPERIQNDAIAENWMEGFTYNAAMLAMRSGFGYDQALRVARLYLGNFDERYDPVTGDAYAFVAMGATENRFHGINNYGQPIWRNSELFKLVRFMKANGLERPEDQAAFQFAYGPALRVFWNDFDARGLSGPLNRFFRNQNSLRFDIYIPQEIQPPRSNVTTSD